ncbi:hypothetical protein [Shewanella sp. TB7-MNA-CIBAN-0143]|uniref:hypothetical protein n=1 Tax=Shewanella sp. TB7-MNA-CIBAN-0143 TaxID=3140465 RepID=UPI00331C8BA8
MSKNKVYEQKKKASGLKKVTVWIPDEAEAELKMVANFCCENRGFIPFMVRSLLTGKMKKGV